MKAGEIQAKHPEGINLKQSQMTKFQMLKTIKALRNLNFENRIS